METRSSYSLIRIGLAIRLLRNIQAGDPKTFLIEHMEMVESGLQQNNFSVSTVAIGSCKEIAKKIEQSEGDTVNKELAVAFTESIGHLESTVYAEAETKTIYVLEQRRFTTDFLLDEPDRLLREGEFSRLGDLARYDLSSACKCLLFGLSTAAAFHILRATEEVLRRYYYKHKKQNRLQKPMWGPMTEELRRKKTKRPPEKLLKALDNIRESYRNPTQHPEAIYDIDDAQNLFGLCLDVVSQMSADLDDA